MPARFRHGLFEGAKRQRLEDREKKTHRRLRKLITLPARRFSMTEIVRGPLSGELIPRACPGTPISPSACGKEGSSVRGVLIQLTPRLAAQNAILRPQVEGA